MNARFEFGENFLEISADRPIAVYYSNFTLNVRSGNFSGLGECEVNLENFRNFICELDDLYDLKRNNARIQSIIGYDSRVEFTLDKSGHVTVSGKASYERQFVEFKFEADQTALPGFINALKEMLEENG